MHRLNLGHQLPRVLRSPYPLMPVNEGTKDSETEGGQLNNQQLLELGAK